MKRIFSNPIAALAAGLGLRLFFVLGFPANSGDTVLYEQIATNWLKHGAYAMNVNGSVTPVDLRMPGYPAFLAFLYACTGRTGADARLAVMFTQIVIDLFSCLLIAAFASFYLCRLRPAQNRSAIFRLSLWLALACPFVANYTAVPLTEVIATFFTVLALLAMVIQLQSENAMNVSHGPGTLAIKGGPNFFGVVSGFLVGLGTLFRPETPLLLIALWIVLLWKAVLRRQWWSWIRVVGISGMACAAALLPWALRNAMTLHEVQFLAPKNSNLPGELVPYGFMAWEKTWLFRVRDCYLVPWKLDEEVINVDDIPGRAFDTPEEKRRVAATLEGYNEDLTLTPEEDAAFAQLARERTARHRLRTDLLLPMARAVAIWFTPRIELLPVSGSVFPLAQNWEDDRIDQSVTIGFFLLNIFYVGLALWGALRMWRWNPAARLELALLLVFLLLRTTFLTTLETPEPRYVVLCFPALIALGAQVFARNEHTG
jgi:hypothetical protein